MNKVLQVGAGVLLVLFLSGCGKGGKSHTAGSSPAGTQPPGDVVSVFTLVGHAQDGRKKWEVQGQTANLLEETVHLSPVAATNFGSVDVHLTAKRGDFHRQRQDVHLEEEVVVTTTDGARLTTDTLDWFAEKEATKTPDWVVITRIGISVLGRGGLGYPKLKRFRLEREVEVTLQGANGETLVTCDGPMELDDARHKVRFWRNVLVRDPKGSIRSDRMDITLVPETNQMEKATFWGHVQIHHENEIAWAHRAHYWQNPGRTSLVGHPRIVMLPKNERWEE